jgi:N-acetylmuramoyl-L-alanine amidase
MYFHCMKKFIFLIACVLLAVGLIAQEQGRFFLVKTIGALPFLEYGTGDDRLGGAKMSYLDSNVVLKVVDSFATDYKVQLSKFHSAYIAKESVQRLEGVAPRPWYLTNSCRVYGDSAFDYVTINMEQKLPYRSMQQINPARIVVDIFGAISNTNWLNQLTTVKEIKTAWYEQLEDDVFRMNIELRHAHHWGHSVNYDTIGKRLIIRIKPQPSVLDIRKLKIAIDAGHGGDNVGSSGVTTGRSEKSLTLIFAKELQAALSKAGVKKIFMTRTTDTSLSIPDRILTLRKQMPDVLISLHLNSAGNDTIKGTSTYYRYVGYRSLTVAILNQLLTLGLSEYGNVGHFNFPLCGPTEYPNCLIEIGFLSNRDDEKKIIDPKFQKAISQKIQQGIVNWLKELEGKPVTSNATVTTLKTEVDKKIATPAKEAAKPKPLTAPAKTLPVGKPGKGG